MMTRKRIQALRSAKLQASQKKARECFYIDLEKLLKITGLGPKAVAEQLNVTRWTLWAWRTRKAVPRDFSIYLAVKEWMNEATKKKEYQQKLRAYHRSYYLKRKAEKCAEE